MTNLDHDIYEREFHPLQLLADNHENSELHARIWSIPRGALLLILAKLTLKDRGLQLTPEELRSRADELSERRNIEQLRTEILSRLEAPWVKEEERIKMARRERTMARIIQDGVEEAKRNPEKYKSASQVSPEERQARQDAYMKRRLGR